MEHLNQEELVLHYYGEPSRPGTSAHLDACVECRQEYQAVQRLLNSMDAAPVPEREADYGKRVWQGVLAQSGILARRQSQLAWRWVMAAAASVVITLGILAWQRPEKEQPVEIVSQDDAVQQRVLNAALESHLESSRVMLTELVNEEGAREGDWSRETAENLLADNRLYRQTAEAAGQIETQRLLEDLEEVLVEVAHTSPGTPEMKQRIETKGVLFAIQVRAAREGNL